MDPPLSNKYKVGEIVARGGMGAILDAQDLNLDRRVAMKVILSASSKTEESRLRFIQEAKILARLEHPNIVPVHDLGRDEKGRVYYTMKFVQGATLKAVLDKIRAGDAETIAKYPLNHLLNCFQKVCDAVAFAHSRGIIHRDLKPENVMIGEFGEVLVMDWGLAKILGVEPRAGPPPVGMAEIRAPASGHAVQTLHGAVMGTPNFMAPEQAEGRTDDIDERADIFALGGILYSILTLRAPIGGATLQEMLANVKSGYIPPPLLFNNRKFSPQGETRAKTVLAHCPGNQIPESLSAVTMKALSLSRESRYQTVKEFQREIEAYQGGYATGAENAGVAKQIALLLRRHKMEVSLAATALSVVLVVATVFTLKVTGTLAELRKTAPSFYAEARGLVDQRKFAQALEKVSYAISLVPDNADYFVLKGNIHQSLLQLGQARDAYRRALKYTSKSPVASENIELCQRLLAETADQGSFPESALLELHAAMLHQGRTVEAIAILRGLKGNKQLIIDDCKAVLNRAGLKGIWNIDAAGNMELDLSNTDVSDLSPVKGMPLKGLKLNNCPNLADLNPLRGMPLENLEAGGTKIKDLNALKGMELSRLWLNGNLELIDLAPLRGMSLRVIMIANSPISDLSPLQGMPLTDLIMSGTRITDLNPLRGMPLDNLQASNVRVSDLTPIKNLPLRALNLASTMVSDLRPLASMPLETLQLSFCDISNISVLRGKPLRELRLDSCKNLHDISALADCKQLERLTIPNEAENIEFLRQLPTLKLLGYSVPGGWELEKMPTIAEFWKAYDEQKSSGKKPK